MYYFFDSLVKNTFKTVYLVQFVISLKTFKTKWLKDNSNSYNSNSLKYFKNFEGQQLDK